MQAHGGDARSPIHPMRTPTTGRRSHARTPAGAAAAADADGGRFSPRLTTPGRGGASSPALSAASLGSPRQESMAAAMAQLLQKVQALGHENAALRQENQLLPILEQKVATLDATLETTEVRLRAYEAERSGFAAAASAASASASASASALLLQSSDDPLNASTAPSFLATMFAFYLRLGMKENSPVQNPEKLYRERGFFAFTIVSFVIFVALMFTEIPILYDWFRFDPPKLAPLWVIG